MPKIGVQKSTDFLSSFKATVGNLAIFKIPINNPSNYIQKEY